MNELVCLSEKSRMCFEVSATVFSRGGIFRP